MMARHGHEWMMAELGQLESPAAFKPFMLQIFWQARCVPNIHSCCGATFGSYAGVDIIVAAAADAA
jgi:hypothetical protein